MLLLELDELEKMLMAMALAPPRPVPTPVRTSPLRAVPPIPQHLCPKLRSFL